jgi:hypothetical protein
MVPGARTAPFASSNSAFRLWHEWNLSAEPCAVLCFY